MRSESGGVAVLMAIAMPILVAMLALVVESGRVALARARLQTAVDRAAYAGASTIAAALGEVAADNWKVHKAWRDLSDDFAADTQQDQEAARQRFSLYEEERDEAIDSIEATQGSAEQRTRLSAEGVFKKNAPQASVEVLPNIDLSLSAEIDRESQWGRPGYGYVTGPIFTDPEDVEYGDFEALKFLAKEPGPGSSVGVFGSHRVRPLMMPLILGEGVNVFAASAAQAFGGSIEGFARKETHTLGDAESSVDDDGADGLYRAAIVPMWTQGDAGAGMVH